MLICSVGCVIRGFVLGGRLWATNGCRFPGFGTSPKAILGDLPRVFVWEVAFCRGWWLLVVFLKLWLRS